MRAVVANLARFTGRLLAAVLVAVGALSLYPSPAAAQLQVLNKPVAAPEGQKAVRKKPAPGRAPAAGLRSTAPAKPAADNKRAANTDVARPAEAPPRPVLTGDEWQDTLLRFEQWLSIQTLYDAEQVRDIKTRFARRIKSLDTAQSHELVKEFDAKLRHLYGAAVFDLQRHLDENLAAAAPAYLKKIRRQLPDVVETTPDELKEQLARFAVRHQSTAEVHQSFEQMRQLRAAAGEARRVEHARPSAASIASANSGGNQRGGRNGYRQAADYFPQNNSSISYSVIPAMPMMTSAGWAMFGGGVAITITRNR